MLNTESLQRLHAALDAQSVLYWWPVLSRLLTDCDGWYQHHAAAELPDPALDEIIDLVEQSGSTDNDTIFASALANLEIARRRAIIRPGLSWSIFDGPFSQLDQVGEIRTCYDTRTPTQRIAYILLGWALFNLQESCNGETTSSR